MKFASCALFVFLALAVQGASGAARAQQKPEQAAEKSAGAWLALVDSGEYAKSWEEAAQYLKGAISKEAWRKTFDAHRLPLGKMQSRKLQDATWTKKLPGAPDGDYVVMKYETSFENKKSAIETVTFMLEKDGKWRAAGYFIR